MLLRAFFPQIRPHCKFTHVFNCPPMWKGELQFAPTRVLSERWQISCKVDHNYTLQASASGYKSSEPVTFRANTNDPERVPMKVQDFRLSER